MQLHGLLLIKPIPKGWKAEFDWLVDTQRALYPRSGHLSTINLASGKVRQPETDVLNTEPRRLDHIKQRLLFISCSSWTETPRNAYHWLLAIQSILWLHRIKLGVWQQMATLSTSIYIEPLAPYVQGRMQGVGNEGVRTLLSSEQHPVTRAAEV